MQEMKGYIVPIYTPFNENGSVDHGALQQSISYLIDEGIFGITLPGSFGEYPLLTPEERIELFETAVDEGDGRCAHRRHRRRQYADRYSAQRGCGRCGADGLMIVPPPYLLPSDRDLLNHFTMIAEACNTIGVTPVAQPA